MDRRFVTVLIVSLLFALVVTVIFYKLTSSAPGPAAQAAAAPSEMRELVVAARPLNMGAMVKAEDIKLVKFPAAQFPKGAFSKPEEVIDRPVVAVILADEPVLEGRLAQRGSGIGLMPKIPRGMRAVTISVSDVAGVAGFVLPGARVDVLVTGTPPRGGGETMTRTVLQNMTVLSADTNLQTDSKTQAIQARTVTLLATPEQSETLTLAQSQGRIQLILRNGTDEDLAKTPGSDVNKLFAVKGGVRASAPAASRDDGEWTGTPVRRRVPVAVSAQPVSMPVLPVSAPPPPPAPPEVVVFRGQQKTVETVAPARAN